MGVCAKKIIRVVAAVVLITAQPIVAPAARADISELDELFQELQDPAGDDWEAVEKRIWKVWSQSGSDAMDLLLERGRQAIRAGDLDKAVEHLTALTDHAPDFAEGWNVRATAFFMLEEYALAVADIEQVLALNPRHFGAISGLAMIFEAVNQPENALKAYRAALAVHPHRADIQEAIERLEQATDGISL
ncbi:MAG: tetratricopeptide repeat protein [Rhodobacteraceae bacterium]|nr:tetratricopeptide repeat protein [Paracoccaceae bacterium]